MTFIKDKFHTYFSDVVVEIKKETSLVTHADLLACLEQGDKEGYRIALQKHFQVYRIFLRKRREQGISR
jgi:DNA-binding FadR family transcriptional regulator